MSHSRGYASVAGLAVLAALATFVLLGGCGGAPADQPSGGSELRDPDRDLRAAIPQGWRVIGEPITDVVSPRQLLAASSYEIALKRKPKSCYPREALRQMPADGALVQVIEYTRHVKLSRFPPKPEQLRYSDGSFGAYECLGPSYRFVFAKRGRALQAHVWLNRERVDPEVRRQALELIDSIELDRGDPAPISSAHRTRAIRCRTGEPPDYFVPRPESSAISVVGCARLGVSEKTLELSVNKESIAGTEHICINPAYPGRGSRAGIYIPAACRRLPIPRRLEVVDMKVPSQGVEGYERVVWGTSRRQSGQVLARFDGAQPVRQSSPLAISWPGRLAASSRSASSSSSCRRKPRVARALCAISAAAGANGSDHGRQGSARARDSGHPWSRAANAILRFSRSAAPRRSS